MLRQFCLAQNIRALISEDLPKSLSAVKDAFVTAFDDDRRGSLINDILAFEDCMTYKNTATYTRLDDELYGLFQNRSTSQFPDRRVLMQQTCYHRGVQYAVFTHSKADSYVIFGSWPSREWRAGRITDIFVQTHHSEDDANVNIWAAIHEFVPLNNKDSSNDPFRKQCPQYYFPAGFGSNNHDSSSNAQGEVTNTDGASDDARPNRDRDRADAIGKLFYHTIFGPKRLVNVREIVCHCAHTALYVSDIQKMCCHIIPLDRVSLFFRPSVFHSTYTLIIGMSTAILVFTFLYLYTSTRNPYLFYLLFLSKIDVRDVRIALVFI